MCVSTRGIKFVHCHNVKYCSRKTNDRVKISVVTNVCNKSKARVLFGNLLFFSFHLPWALGRCSRPALTALAYYNNRSKQLAFAELQHLTLEPLLFATLYKYLWNLTGKFSVNFPQIWTFKPKSLLWSRDPQLEIEEGISPVLSLLLFNFFMLIRKGEESELRLCWLEKLYLYLELTWMLF